ncbi:MAG: hypothetical protein RXR70_04140 [Acidilobus sp.]
MVTIYMFFLPRALSESQERVRSPMGGDHHYVGDVLVHRVNGVGEGVYYAPYEELYGCGGEC